MRRRRRQRAGRRSFLWAVHYCAALATYPEVVTHRAGTCAPNYPNSRKTGANRGAPRAPPLFGLAPCGVFPATAITDGAVRSYRTFSPLPRPTPPGGPSRASPKAGLERGTQFLGISGSSWAGRYVFCGTFRQRHLNAAARTLSGTPLCGVRTFLCPPAKQAGSDRPAQQLTAQL